MKFELVADSLTVGELCDLTDVAGPDATELLAQGHTTPKTLLGLVWILGRRDNPAFTLEQAREVKVSELEIVDTNGDQPPAEANGQTSS